MFISTDLYHRGIDATLYSVLINYHYNPSRLSVIKWEFILKMGCQIEKQTLALAQSSLNFIKFIAKTRRQTRRQNQGQSSASLT